MVRALAAVAAAFGAPARGPRVTAAHGCRTATTRGRHRCATTRERPHLGGHLPLLAPGAPPWAWVASHRWVGPACARRCAHALARAASVRVPAPLMVAVPACRADERLRVCRLLLATGGGHGRRGRVHRALARLCRVRLRLVLGRRSRAPRGRALRAPTRRALVPGRRARGRRYLARHAPVRHALGRLARGAAAGRGRAPPLRAGRGGTRWIASGPAPVAARRLRGLPSGVGFTGREPGGMDLR